MQTSDTQLTEPTLDLTTTSKQRFIKEIQKVIADNAQRIFTDIRVNTQITNEKDNFLSITEIDP